MNLSYWTDMYQEQFGLSRKPFRANATGASVFVGPQTAKLMGGMKKALAAADSVAAVTGQPGVGKTTLVNRAIDAVAGDKLVIRVSRMQLGHDEVLEFLLEQLDAGELPASTIKKINQFRDLLAHRTNAGTRVIVVIEDAVKIGEDALAEFESLTAADGSDSDGANIILMGDESLLETLKAPALRRLQQRTRLRHPIQSLTASELQGYLKHCFRNAGAEFDLIFAAGAAQILFEASQGNPRVANNLVESVLATAFEQKADKVENAVIARVAREEFGIAVDLPSPAAAMPQPLPDPEPEPKPEPEPQPAPAPELRLEPESEPRPVAEASVEDAELTQDTLPNLDIIAPGLAAQRPVISSKSEPATTPAPQAVQPSKQAGEIPTLFASTRMQTPPAAAPEPAARPEEVQSQEAQSQEAQSQESTPAWDRDPTFAELRPDIEALEQAMADFQEPKQTGEEDAPEPDTKIELKDPTLPSVPEITLDVAIERKIHEAQEALEKTDGMIPEKAAPTKLAKDTKPVPTVSVPPLVNPPPATPEVVSDGLTDRKADSEMEKIAAGLAAAKSIEDVDDQLAETLFGEDFSLIAAQVGMNAPESPQNVDTEVATGTPASEEPATTPLGVAPDDETDSKANGSALEQEFKEVYGENALEVSIETPTGGGLDLSASQRLATVRALNADRAPAVGLPLSNGAAANGSAKPTQAAATPDPIEDQINTSMTQTLKALSSHPPSSIISNDDDDDEEDGKSGFFSRFKRS